CQQHSGGPQLTF
nr:immunoglobulin light chain junction region [Macaca mulatta]